MQRVKAHLHYPLLTLTLIFVTSWNVLHLKTAGIQSEALLAENELTTAVVNKVRSSGIAIFLNAFINPRQVNRSVGIIKEQMDQWINASKHKQSTLYYNIIGSDYNVSFCPEDRLCYQKAYYPEAFEEVTLQSLYEYCDANPDDYVVYLHNKGSLHNGDLAQVIRRIGTKAALSDECYDIMNHKTNETSNCNVCSHSFQTHPHNHVPGNFWAAKCDYVEKLIPPKSYSNARRQLCQVLAHLSWPLDFCPPNNETHEINRDYGFGRYAMERWIPSHPSFVACEVRAKSDALRNLKTGFEPWTPILEVSMRRAKRVSEQQEKSMKLLIYEHAFLYQNNESVNDFCNSPYFKKRGCPDFVRKQVWPQLESFQAHPLFSNLSINLRNHAQIMISQ